MVYHHHRNGRILLGILSGVLLLLLCVSITIAADPSVSITVSKWAQAPLAPTDFQITELSTTSINITWTMGTAANITIIRGSTSGYPFTVSDGTEIYSGNLTYVVVNDLSLSDTLYYFRAWSQNEYGTSAGYAQATAGTGTTSADLTELMALMTGLIDGPTGIVNMMFAVALMGFAFWKRGWLRVILATSLIIWGAFMLEYDVKVAAPFVSVGSLLFVIAIFGLIENYRATRREAQWAN